MIIDVLKREGVEIYRSPIKRLVIFEFEKHIEQNPHLFYEIESLDKKSVSFYNPLKNKEVIFDY